MAQVPDIDVTTVSVGGSAYTVPFVYQNRAEVFVEVDGVSTAFTWINDGNISITPAPAAGAVVRRYRSTSALGIRHDYRNGVPFTPKNIAENNDQLLFVVQEATSTAADAEATANGIAATAAAAVATANAADTKAQLALDTTWASGVSSFNTRTGAVMPAAGDYTASQITHNTANVGDALDGLQSALTLLAGATVGQTGATGAAVIPAGTEAQRPASPVNGQLRYNSEESQFEGYQGGDWKPLGDVQLAGRVGVLEGKTEDSGWLTPTLINGWRVVAGLQAPQYKKVGNRVYIRGVVDNPMVSSSNVFSLPAGYRPPAALRVVASYGNAQVVFILVSPAGDVMPTGGVAGSVLPLNFNFEVAP